MSSLKSLSKRLIESFSKDPTVNSWDDSVFEWIFESAGSLDALKKDSLVNDSPDKDIGDLLTGDPVVDMELLESISGVLGPMGKVFTAHLDAVNKTLRASAMEVKHKDRASVDEAALGAEKFLNAQEGAQNIERLSLLVITPGSPIIDLSILAPETMKNEADFKANLLSLQAVKKGYKKKAFKMVVCVLAAKDGYTEDELKRLTDHGDSKLKDLKPQLSRKGMFTGLSRAMAWRQKEETPDRISAVDKLLGALEIVDFNHKTLSAKWKLVLRASAKARREANTRM